MNKLSKSFAVGLTMLFVALIVAPSAAFADSNAIRTDVFNPTILAGPLVICTGTGSPGGSGTSSLPACSNLCDLVAQIANLIYYAIAFVIWIIAPILIAVGGIMIMLGGASPEMVGRGKKTITGAVWSIVIVLVAWLIVFTFVSAFGNLGKYVAGFGSSGGCISSGSTAPSPSPTTSPLY